jgi:hypothetical protein
MGAWPLAFEHRVLLSWSEDSERCIYTTAEEDADGCQQCGDQLERESMF